MKKIITLTIVTTLVLTMGSTSVFAASRGENFVDKDGDGVCDNIGSGNGGYFVDKDGDGVCDNIGRGNGRQNNGKGRGRNR